MSLFSSIKQLFSRKQKAETVPDHPQPEEDKHYGLVLSGGGTRAAYQVGVLRAVAEWLDQEQISLSVAVGTSIGAVNTVVFSTCYHAGYKESIRVLEELWTERTYRNTFRGSVSFSFLRALKLGFIQYLSPGPKASSFSLFDPKPLLTRIDQLLADYGALDTRETRSSLRSVAVMTTREGISRKGLLIINCKDKPPAYAMNGVPFDVHYVDKLSAAHAFASAALPSVLPPVELSLDTGQMQLVDGGIADNIPVDPAVRLGATDVIVIDVSGKKWWCDHYGKSYDVSDPWETVSAAGSFCVRPQRILEFTNPGSLGDVLRAAIGKSTRDYIAALGPTWPVFKLLKHRLGEDIAYEIMSYAVIHKDYIAALIEKGYQDAHAKLFRHHSEEEFHPLGP